MFGVFNNKLMMFWLCMLLHLIADFSLQGILADMKRKVWWDNHTNSYNRAKYKNDYQIAMLCHALMWSLVTFFPLAFVVNKYAFSCIVVWNAWIHGTIDHFKANALKLNLVEDQTFHVLQIIITILVVYHFV